MNESRVGPPPLRARQTGPGVKSGRVVRPRTTPSNRGFGTKVWIGLLVGASGILSIAIMVAVGMKLWHSDKTTNNRDEDILNSKAISSDNRPEVAPSSSDQGNEPVSVPSEAASSTENERLQSSSSTITGESQTSSKPEQTTKNVEDSGTTSIPKSPPNESETQSAIADVFKKLGANGCLNVPLPDNVVTKATLLSSLPMERFKNELTLSVVGVEVVLGDADKLVIVKKVENQETVWDLQIPSRQSVTGTLSLGHFATSPEGLTFKWNRSASSQPSAFLFRYCLLKLEGGGQSATCVLSQPQVIAAQSIDLYGRQPRLEVPISTEKLPSKQSLRSEIKFTGFHRTEQEPARQISVDESQLAKVFLEKAGHEEHHMEIETTFHVVKSPVLSFHCFGFPDRLVKEIESAEREDLRKDAENRRAEVERKKQLEKNISAKMNEVKSCNHQCQSLIQMESAASLNERAQIEQRIDMIRQKKEEFENLVEQFQDELKQIDALAKWRKQLAMRLNAWKTSGRIEARIFIEIDGRQIDIIHFKSNGN
jgi:hypothetical protein